MELLTRQPTMRRAYTSITKATYSQLLVPQRSTLTTSYERNGKKKILHAYFQGPGHTFINIDRVFELYDRVYCVDTNTAVARNGFRVAITTAIIFGTQVVLRLAFAVFAVGVDEQHVVALLAARLVEHQDAGGDAGALISLGTTS